MQPSKRNRLKFMIENENYKGVSEFTGAVTTKTTTREHVTSSDYLS